MMIVYSCLHAYGVVDMVSVSEMTLGVISSLILAFIAGGISVIWRIEKLPLMWASFLHASILFLDYILIYLINGWMPFKVLHILSLTIYLSQYHAMNLIILSLKYFIKTIQI